MNAIGRLCRIIGLLLGACALAAGCSAIRTVYNQAEHLVAWRLNDYFDLSESQRELFRARFAGYHRWHRTSQLPGYVRLLGTVEERLERGPRSNDIDWLRTQVRTTAQTAITHGQADMVALLASLDERQIEHARQRFERDNRKWAREHAVGASSAEQRHARTRVELERIEHWTGSLTRDQKTRIGELLEALPLDTELRRQDRLRRQSAFLALLAHRKDVQFPLRLQRWLHDWDADRPAALAAEEQRIERLRNELYVHVHALLDAAQRQRVKDRLRWYAETMRELAGAPGSVHAEADPVSR